MKTLSVVDLAHYAMQKRPAFNVPWRPALMRYAAHMKTAADYTRHVDACMLAAIVDRETGGQNEFQFGVPHGDGCGVGLCQVTSGVDWTSPAAPQFPGVGALLDPQTNITVAARFFLEPALCRFPNDHIAAFAAFNLGGEAVARELYDGVRPDARTSGHDYGHAVFADWINFAAVSLGYAVDWSTFR